jgi:hypothetical protein
VGTSFSFTVNEPVQVTLTFTQSLSGRHVAGRCRALSDRDRRDEPCRRTLTRGTLTISANAGTRHLRLQGRIAGRELPLGRYTVALVATNTSTHQRSTTRTLHFTIVG